MTAKGVSANQDSVFVIAEVGSVHDGSFGNAQKLLEAAATCGADAVKFQTHIAEAETLADAPAPDWFGAEARFDYFRRTAFSEAQLLHLKEMAAGLGVEFLSSPFSLEAVDLLERVDIPRYKVPSGEVTNLPLLERMCSTGKPIILSSGMSSWAELDRAVEFLKSACDELSVLQCTTEYPCAYERVGLNVMLDMKKRYGVPVGLSDHTLTDYAALSAVTLGARIIEKHFTFSRRMYGSDAAHSMAPEEFARMVEGIRAVEAMVAADVDKDDLGRVRGVKEIFEKSVVAGVDIPAGTKIERAMLAFKKPGTGISAAEYAGIVGRVAKCLIRRDSLIAPDQLK